MVHSDHRVLSIVLFDGFELLDVFGPAELCGVVPGFEVRYVAVDAGMVTSSHGCRVVADQPLAHLAKPDVLMVPGGRGTRALVDDQDFVELLADRASRASIVSSVCTGSAVLAAAGLLDGYRATSNKRAFEWATKFGANVHWEHAARWVHDRDRWTSSGVSAGMDMAVALIAHLFGEDAATEAAHFVEYEPHRDPSWDPFAVTS